MSWRILIVDDSAAARSQLRVILEAKGVLVIEAENGREGLWRAQAETVDMVFSDVHMPVMGGLQMIQELRKRPEYVSTPIFVLTSDATSTRAEEGKKAGASSWMVKPMPPDMLWKVIEHALFGRQLASSTNIQTVSGEPTRFAK